MALSSMTMAAEQSQRRIAVLQPDSELYRAISLSLSAWDVQTLRSDETPPGLSQPEAVQAASSLAHRLGVDAVVWVSSTDGGSLLWVFDARAGDVTTRMLVEKPPFDSSAAASVALSVKTVLRTSTVAPPEERLGLEPPPPPRAPRAVALELGLGGSYLAEREVALRFELAGVAWIFAARRLGVGLELSTGPALTIDARGFVGRFVEHVGGAEARFRLLHEAPISAEVAFGGALHFTTIEATLVEHSVERRVSRVNGSLDLELSIQVHLGVRTYLGASAGASYLPRYRRYLVEGEPVFSPWQLPFGFSGYGGVELF